MSEWVSERKLFLSSWPYGRLRYVDTLGRNPNINQGIYIRYLDTGGTDTTTSDFLFDLPEQPTSEYKHGVSKEFNCNGCSDE